MIDSMRCKIEQVIRTYGSEDAPVSSADIMAELGLAGRTKSATRLTE